ncbi:hypothetical protein N8I77_001697 [Diaporthe amygdali]|uniref:Uncharacterized protein n=1 Tax=Phomopsis amygdali TaxID=1214568 RepID=A0AAD9SS23_PHOAM|nr:uncharacterized protein J7T55_006996 [Diaporthe amygdali]KAJ0104070.1 hypothetical protein J7T55_006996 [Diaporthe amygdali]KAK2614907.1 hypothetical protein N8I77_001697 [Diaporthe amygdali]
MFGTKTLSSLKDFLPQIHQPLPLNRRESQLLLKTLTTSFRNNLDKEHGYWNENTSTVSLKAAKHASTTASASASSSGPHDPHHRPIDRHVRAILSNPLFSYDRAAHNTRPAPERDPMDVFDEAVAKGLMNPQRAAGVLKAKRHSITQSSTISVNETVASSGTARRVLQWLRSHGLERDLSFVSCTPLIAYLTQFMVEEGLEEIAWAWLERLMSGEGPDSAGWKSPSPAAYILDSLVRAKALYGNSLDGGYACMIRAQQMFNSKPTFDTDVISAWRALSWWSTVSAWQRSQPSEALFDAFAALGRQLERSKTTFLVDRAHLDLHHPTHPDANLSIGYLESCSLQTLLDQEKQEDQQAFQTCSHTRKYNAIVKRVALMGIDTVNHLSRVGREEEADWVGNLLTDRFGLTLVAAFKPSLLGTDVRASQHSIPAG